MPTNYLRSQKSRFMLVNYDSALLLTYLFLCGIGLYMMLNLSSVREIQMTTFIKQLIWFIISAVAMFITFVYIDLKKIRSIIPYLTFINIILLFLVLFLGRESKGAIRSFSFFGVSFQPSLTARVMLVMYFAHFIDKKKELLPDTTPMFFLKHFLPMIVITLVSFAIILKQRHLSTIIISSMTLLSILWIVRVRLKTILVIVLIGAIGLFGVLKFGASYRSSRMEVYKKYSLFHKILGIQAETVSSDDYQTRESLTSLSKGGFFGVSSDFGQAKNFYLPESNTDYIFSVIGEERGFIGAILVFVAYCLIFFRGLLGSWKVEDLYLKIIGIGLTLNIFYNAIVNIGVAMSAFPSTGVTLPFISYGGTSLLTNSIALGLILNVTAKRQLC